MQRYMHDIRIALLSGMHALYSGKYWQALYLANGLKIPFGDFFYLAIVIRPR